VANARRTSSSLDSSSVSSRKHWIVLLHGKDVFCLYRGYLGVSGEKIEYFGSLPTHCSCRCRSQMLVSILAVMKVEQFHPYVRIGSEIRDLPTLATKPSLIIAGHLADRLPVGSCTRSTGLAPTPLPSGRPIYFFDSSPLKCPFNLPRLSGRGMSAP
jgi:hypothetical protein